MPRGGPSGLPVKSVISSPRFVFLALVLLVAPPVHAQEQASLLHTAPAQAEPGATLVVDGVLSGTQRIQRVVVRFRGPGEPYSEAPMELQYGDLYRGIIPSANVVPPGVEYYVEGYTAGGERVPLFKSATRPARVIVVGQVPSTRTPLTSKASRSASMRCSSANVA